MKADTSRISLVLPAALFLFSGCGDPPRDAASGGHRHDSAHGGVAVELGEHQFHLDFLHDSRNGTLTAWVMDGHLSDFVRIPATSFEVAIATANQTNRVTLTASANPVTGETVGDSAQFRGEADWLKGLAGFTATVTEIQIRGSRFASVPFSYP